MKIRTDICPEEDEEIVIRCRGRTELITRIETLLEKLVLEGGEMLLCSGSTEFYVPLSDILFFEAFDGKTYAHTKDKTLRTDKKLFQLEDALPAAFVRISKSTVANVLAVLSLRRELSGNGEISFRGSDKKAYFSRSYYKALRDKLNETRLGK